MTMEQQLQLDNFNLETELINEQIERQKVELAQFETETKLIEKGVL